MAGAAVILLLSMLAPSMTPIVCDVQCAHAERDVVPESPPCHELKPSGSFPALTQGQTDLCHDEATSVIGSVSERLTSLAGPVRDPLPAVDAARGSSGSLAICLNTSPSNQRKKALTIQLRV